MSKKRKLVATAGQRGAIRRFFSILGPGVITGAADDDPSGIATYSIAGAQLGTSLLWTAFLTWPLMAAVQMACARIGMVTGGGLAGALRKKLPRWLLVTAALALFGANTINIAADLSGMADAAEMLCGLNSHYFVVLFGVAIAAATIRLRYQQIARTLKWLALVLFAYVITAIVVGPDWSVVLRDAFLPSLPRGREAWGTLVAILGTTISPYLFFWQASQEVEEEKGIGETLFADRQGATQRELANRRLDVGIGTFFSNMVMFFIILTTALTLHRHGVTNPQTSREVAEALRPFGGRFTQILYTIGLLGVGFLAIPTLSGSAAYAFAETFRWKQGLDRSLKGARSFYVIVIASTILGIALDFLKVNAVKALYWSAVINGLLAPFLLVGILIVASDRKIMEGQPISRLSRAIIGTTAALMFAAAIGMFIL
ncbi:MAG TPA: divalent metal cation transporter [Thermoanaerobaculia bacterium]|nr:divalent metal cation transporter [Thermoanaerobaculia bacterium]